MKRNSGGRNPALPRGAGKEARRRAFSGGVWLFSPLLGALRSGPPYSKPCSCPSSSPPILSICLSGPSKCSRGSVGSYISLFKRAKNLTFFFFLFYETTQKKNLFFSDGRRGARHAAPRGLHPPPRPAAAERRRPQVRGDWRACQVQGPGDRRAVRDGRGVQDFEGAGSGGGGAESSKRRCR